MNLKYVSGGIHAMIFARYQTEQSNHEILR